MSAREAPSACIFEICQQRIKSLKMVVETSFINEFSYFYDLNSFSKVTTLTKVLKLSFENFGLISFIVWKLCGFRHR